MNRTTSRKNEYNQQLLDRVVAGVDKSRPVLVTGADGYVAGVLVQHLLRAGFSVHGTHRMPVDQLDYLRQLTARAPDRLKLFPADLLTPRDFDQAMAGCTVVFHTASPFVLADHVDPYRDLIQPAVEGTRNVLQSATDSKTVRRVVLTSSVGAIYADAADSSLEHPLTEADWNRSSSYTHQSYFLSKTMAETAAWVMAGSQTNWSLVVVNPSMILGPGLRYHGGSESFRTLHKIGNGHWTMLAGCPNIAMPAVDVRDVAAAHMLVAFDERHQGRHIISAANSHLPEFATILARYFPHFPIPRMSSWMVPKWAAWLITPYLRQGVDRLTIWRNMNVPILLDTTKSRAVLGLQYRPLEETVVEMYQQMIDAGAVQPGVPPEFKLLALVVLIIAVICAYMLQLQAMSSSSSVFGPPTAMPSSLLEDEQIVSWPSSMFVTSSH